MGFGGSRTVANPNLNGWGWWCLVTAFLQPTGPIQCVCCVREYACTPSTQLVKAGADKSQRYFPSRGNVHDVATLVKLLHDVISICVHII